MKTSNRTTKLNFLDWLFLIFIGTFLLLFNYKSKAQPFVDWKINYNNVFSQYDKGLVIVTDNDCNSYIAGTTWNGMDLDYLVIKLDRTGDTVWTQTYNGSGNGDDIPAGMATDNSGNIFVTGSSLGIGTGQDYLTLKINYISGQIMESNRKSDVYDAYPSKIVVASTGHVYVTGYANNYFQSNSNEDFLTVRYDNSLVEICDGPQDGGFHNIDKATVMAINPTGTELYVAGSSVSGSSKQWLADRFTFSTNNCNKFVSYGGGAMSGSYVPGAMLVSNTGKLYVAGSWAGDMIFNRYNNPSNLFIQFNDYSHTITNGGDTEDGATGLVAGGSGYIYVCGYQDSDPSVGVNKNIVVAKYDVTALQGSAPEWVSAPFNGSGNSDDMPVNIFWDNAPSVPSVYVVGYTTTSVGLKEMIALRYDASNGMILDTIELTNTTAYDEICTGASMDNYDNIILTGYNDDPSGHQLIAAKISTNIFNPTITWTSLNTLMVSSGDSYQWFLNGNLLAGEDNQTINIGPIGNGNYTCEVSKFCCTFNSSMIAATVGMNELAQSKQKLQVYPNPAINFIDITWNPNENVKDLIIYDIKGRIVSENEFESMSDMLRVNLEKYMPGIYYIIITTNHRLISSKISIIKSN